MLQFKQLKRENSRPPHLQAKLKVGRPGDKYEHEADAAADRVLRMTDTDQIQMQPIEEEEEELMPKLRMQPIEEEEEMMQPKIQMQTEEEEEELLQPKLIQKQACSSCGDKELPGKQTSSTDVQNSPSSHIESCCGQALPDSTRGFFESRFGHNFRNVKVHTCDSAVQMNSQLGSQAFTYDNNIFFNKGKYNPENPEGRQLLAHELTHVVQQNNSNGAIQRKLTVEDDYPKKYVDSFIGKQKKGKDISESLSNTERLGFVSILLGKLSPHFNVEGTGQVKSAGKKEPELVKDSKATASCCMHILTRKSSTNDWKILVADHLSPHTLKEETSILINSELSPVKFGTHTSTGRKHIYDKAQVILGHEMCGHAALMELKAHPEGKRAVTNVHDPTVKIENEIAKEQGVKKENLRGLATAGVHRGESFGKMVIEQFKLNMGSIYGLPSSEQNKMRMLADMIRTFDMFVELRGHSDNQGSEAAKQEVSDRRARLAQKFLMNMGVTWKAEVSISKDKKISVTRFLRKGLSDKEPPEGVNPARQDRFRRVEVIVASFPWALSELPPGISEKQQKKMDLKKTIENPGNVEKLKKSGTPCEQLLIEKAY